MYQKVRLISKRNEVFRITSDEGTYVSKIFANEYDMIREIEMLTTLQSHGINVPKIIQIKSHTIILEDLGEETLLDKYERWEKQDDKNYRLTIIKLCEWMKKFYDAAKSMTGKQIILSDVNFRNFIIRDDQIYGIDFEQSSTGHIETDIGKMIAYALTYDPAMTEWKILFCEDLIKIFVENLHLDIDSIKDEQKKELKSIGKRRSISPLRFFN